MLGDAAALPKVAPPLKSGAAPNTGAAPNPGVDEGAAASKAGAAP